MRRVYEVLLSVRSEQNLWVDRVVTCSVDEKGDAVSAAHKAIDAVRSGRISTALPALQPVTSTEIKVLRVNPVATIEVE